MSQSKEQELATLLVNAKTMADVERIIELATDLFGTIQWRPVGDRPNNAGIINVASSPASAIVERITNMIDALLELAYELNPQSGINSPAHAAYIYYGVPATGLGDISDDKARRALAENLVLSLDDSGNAKRPTVRCTDAGIGQSPSDMPSTLLSLNESNKLGKPYTMGTYNQGGGASYSFSKATVVVSRRHPKLNTGQDLVGFTVVLERDDKTKKVASYEYLVDSNRDVMALDPALFPSLPYGTVISHVEYDLQLSGPWTTQPYMFFQGALPSPILPFLLTGTRTKPKDPAGSRAIVGNAARLDNAAKARGDIEVPYKESVELDLGSHGRVTVKYWVVRRPAGSTSTSDPTASYVDAGTAIGISLHGQRQDSEARSWINTRAKLPFIYKNLIVEIKADDLTQQAKKELFASTRERARLSDVRTKIYDSLADILRTDDELKRLNGEERERLLKKSTSAANDKIRKRLSKFIKTALKERTKPGKGAGKGAGSTSATDPGPTPPRPTRPPSPPRDISDDHLPVIPTHLRFEKDAMIVRQGASGQVWVEVDAKNNYLPMNDGALQITVDGPDPSKLRVTARSALGGGKSRWRVTAEPDAPLGDYKISAALTTPADVLSDSMPITVTPPPPAPKGTDNGSEPETGPNVQWVLREDWDAHGFNEHSVGRVLISDEATDIFINRHYEPLETALSSPSLTGETIESRAERYQFPVACALWLQQHELSRLPTGAQAPSEEWRAAELRRTAEAVILAINPESDIEPEVTE